MRSRSTFRRAASTFAVTMLLLGTMASAALAGTSIDAKALTDHDCDAGEWHFVITGVRGVGAPASVDVTWADGSEETVLHGRTTGNVAHYTTTSNLDVPVESATADVAARWSGQFNLSHGPCGLEAPDPSDDDPGDGGPGDDDGGIGVT